MGKNKYLPRSHPSIGAVGNLDGDVGFGNHFSLGGDFVIVGTV